MKYSFKARGFINAITTKQANRLFLQDEDVKGNQVHMADNINTIS